MIFLTFILFPILFYRLVEVHSPDAKHMLVLRSKDSAAAQVWFNAIHSCVSDLIPKVISEVKDQLGKTGIAGGREIKHLGWLTEKVTATFSALFHSLLCVVETVLTRMLTPNVVL